MQIFYSSIAAEINTSIEIDGQEHLHISKSLRKKIGDIIYIVNGKGCLFEAEIRFMSKKQTQVLLLKVILTSDKKAELVLAVAPTKNIGRYEWLIEKCTEIGVKSILPFTSYHSERKVVKHERLNTMTISAMKQSKQLFLPTIGELVSFKQVLKEAEGFDVKLIAYCEEQAITIKNELKALPTFVLIGPEGGFSSQEVEMAKEKGFKSVTLGENRLRTETAAVYVASVYNVLT